MHEQLREPHKISIGVHLQLVDALQGLMALPDESVDLVVTDPPYVSLEKHRNRGTTTRLKVSKASSNEWFETIPNHYLVGLFTELYRVLRKERHAYIFCDDETLQLVWQIAESEGFYPWKALTWVKTLEAGAAIDYTRLKFLPNGKLDLDMEAHELGAMQVRSGTGYHHAASKENILFLEKRSTRYSPPPFPEPRPLPPGKGRQLKGGSMVHSMGQAGDVLFSPRARGGYPTEKPVGPIQVLVDQSTQPLELVLDPFFGSGSALEACLRLGRRFVGFDNSTRAYETAAERRRTVAETLGIRIEPIVLPPRVR